MTTSIYVDSTGVFTLTFTDSTGLPLDPAALTLVVKNPTGATMGTLTGVLGAPGDFTNPTPGTWIGTYDTVSSDVTGYWRAESKAYLAGEDDVSVTRFYVGPLAGTTYFNVIPDMVRLRYRDMDNRITDADIFIEAQAQENWVMLQRGIGAAPANPIELANMQLATILLTCAAIEAGEPYSSADGQRREDRFQRVLWKKQADDIILEYNIQSAGVPVSVRRWGE